MPIRLRKFIGTVLLLVLVTVWALVAMALAQAPTIRDSTALSITYYVVRSRLGLAGHADRCVDEQDLALSGVRPPESIPHRRRRAGQQHAHITDALIVAVE